MPARPSCSSVHPLGFVTSQRIGRKHSSMQMKNSSRQMSASIKDCARARQQPNWMAHAHQQRQSHQNGCWTTLWRAAWPKSESAMSAARNCSMTCAVAPAPSRQSIFPESTSSGIPAGKFDGCQLVRQ